MARFLKERLPKVLTCAVETQGSVLGGGKPAPHKVEGIGASFIPGNFDKSVCDEILMVSDADAFAMVKTLAAREGVLSGSSGGASVFAALQVARRLGSGKRVVTMIPDSQLNAISPKKSLTVESDKTALGTGNQKLKSGFQKPKPFTRGPKALP